MDPILEPGKESAATWNRLIENLPPGVKNRIVALVSDGIRGIEAVAKEHNFIIQRCHFHLLSCLQEMRGKRATTLGRTIREEIYHSVYLALSQRSKRKLNNQCQ